MISAPIERYLPWEVKTSFREQTLTNFHLVRITLAFAFPSSMLTTMTLSPILESLPQKAFTELPGAPYPHVSSGKVREIFDLGDYYLMVATDRLSAFNFIFQEGVPGKGILLTQLSKWWFNQTKSIITNHLPENESVLLDRYLNDFPELKMRSMIVKKLDPLPIEAIVRGYITGTGWLEYQEKGSICGNPLPKGLQEFDKLPNPIFTPTIKAKDFDSPLTLVQAQELLGKPLYNRVFESSMKLYQLGSDLARKAGLILVDCKFELGSDSSGNLFLIDEILTPDAARYWDIASKGTENEHSPFDKQVIRNYLLSTGWNKKPPLPKIPEGIILAAQKRYIEVLRRFLG